PTASIGPPSRSWPPTPANKRSSKFSGASRKATGSTGNPCITGPTARSACTLFTACWVSPCCTTFAAKPRPSGPRSPSKICRKSWSKSNSSYSCIPPRVRVLIEPPPWSPPRASSKKAWPKPWACNNSVVPHVGNTAVSWQLNEKSTTSRSFWRVRSKLPLGVDGRHALEGGQGLDGLSGLLLSDAQIVEALQIDPEFGAGAEEMRQAQCGVGRDIAASVQNLGDAIGGNLQLAGQRGGAHVEFLQFLGQMFSRVDRKLWHVGSFRRSFPSGNRILVIIDNFHIRRTRGAVWPFKANAPRVIDANAVWAFPAALQGLEPVSRQNGKVTEREGRLSLDRSASFQSGVEPPHSKVLRTR